ncbi:MAG: UDP-N-acetylmuramoyl-tripeptide--D-alanyl-D-alanine ligase [Clostridiaceae bacterium]|nr:UDP-N-acetylmuramoyl-tripeptide--D-alanyl-D-alanine ligase [Clostridiaceae bacterium]
MIISLLKALCFLPLAFLVFRRSIHMYQLCSYQNASYKKYLSENIAESFSIKRLLPLALTEAGVLWFWPMAVFGSLLFFVVNPIRKGKKPLVWTDRVKRLSVTGALCYLACCAVMPLLGIYVLFMPYIVMALAAVNAPIEKAIAGWYVNDAKRLLRENEALTVIGITGSYGKTSTKYFLKELLSVQYNVYMTPGNYNTTLGVTRAIREGLKPVHDIFLCEMGARHVGDISELCRFVEPDIGIVTSIGPQHLETFGSFDNIISEKLELYRATKEKGGAFLNMDSPAIAAQSYEGNITLYGTGLGCDYRGSDIKIGPFGSEFTITGPDGQGMVFKTKLLGRANVQNIIGAVAVANKLDIPMAELIPAVRSLESVPHRLCLICGGADTWYIDDAYNSNPEGSKVALETLSMCEGMTRIMVTPGMVELGELESRLNYEMGTYAASCCDYAVLVDKKRGADIKSGLIEGGFPEEKIFFTDSLEKGLNYTKSIAGSKMILLLNDLPDHY